METFNLSGRKVCALLSAVLLFTGLAHADSIYLGGINRIATGTNLGGGHYGLDISGNITASSASAGLTGQTVPTYADFIGASKAGVLTGLLLGQQTMANSLSVTISSDQTSIPISGSITATNPSVGTTATTAPTSATEIGMIDGTGKLQGVSSTNPLPITGSISATNPSVSTTGSAIPASATMIGGSDGTLLKAFKVSTAGVLSVDGSAVTQPISAASLPLPSGAATDSTLSTMSGKLPATLGQKTMANGLAVSIASDQSAIPVTQSAGPWTMNQTQVGGTSITLGSKVSASSYPVVIASDQAAIATKSPLNATASAVTNATISTTPTSITAATNAVEVLVQANDTNSANLRVAIGTTCSSSLGIQLQPGRSETFHTSQNLSVCSESGTQTVNVQWMAQ